MLSPKTGTVKTRAVPAPENRRRSQRRVLNRPARIAFGPGKMLHDCIVNDISDGGVRLRIEGVEVPDEFVLLLTEDGYSTRERAYKVVWRFGPELGAKLLGQTRRSRSYAASHAKG